MGFLREIVLVALLVCAQMLCAQINLYGTVSDNKGQPLDAMVTVFDNGRIIAHGMADESGSYSLKLSTSSDSISIRISMLGFSPVKQTIPAKTQKLDFVLGDGGKTLKEVVVVADKITGRGDTISYNVAAFKNESDRVIGDVMKNMPGIEVSDNGRISFNGKDVKNFYVEDMDLLQGRYGIATNNISAGDVASVQVYQNHQPIRALKDLKTSDDITINLKLKASAKGTWSANVAAGTGYKPALWTAEATAMYFGRESQNITTYKGNNCGINVNGETQALTEDGSLNFTNRSPLAVAVPPSPGIAAKRYIDNRSNAVSINQLFKTDSLSTINFNIDYYHDLLRKSGESATKQYEPSTGNYRSIYQLIISDSYVNTLSGAATVKRNAKNTYLHNAFKIRAGWNNDNALAQTSSSFTSSNKFANQFLDNPLFEITDRLAVVRNTGKHAWEVYINTGWNHKPQSLSVDNKSGESTAGNIIQEYTTDAVKMNLYTSRILRFGKVNVNAGIFTDIDAENVSSELKGTDMPEGYSGRNDFLFGKMDAGIQLGFVYTLRNFHFELTLPVSYDLQWLDDRIDKSRSHGWNYGSVMPNLHMTYAMGHNWFYVDTYYNIIRDNSRRAARGVVMTDYLSFRRSDIERAIIDKTVYCSLGYRFSKPFWQLFGNANISWYRFINDNITGYDYDGLSTVSTTLAFQNSSDRLSIAGNINKGLWFWNATIKINGNASLYKGHSLIGGSMFAYTSNAWNGSAVLSMTPARWLGAALAFAYGESRSTTEYSEGNASPWVKSWTGRGDVNFSPVSNLILNIAVEDNYTNLTADERHVWFSDAKIIYRYGRFDWELAFNNIFNRKVFTKVSYTGMDIYTSTYRLRERNALLTLRLKLF